MVLFRPLPWEYSVRNLLRRPGRSALTLFCLGIVVLLVLLVVSFVRGLDASLAVSGDPRVVLIHSLGAGENIENSTIPGNGAGLLSASIPSIETQFQQKHLSPELFLGTEVTTESSTDPALGLVRGVSLATPLVRPHFQLLSGTWPESGEILAGRLVAAKLGRPDTDFRIGRTLVVEGRKWKVSGHFTAAGAAFESELWCPVEDLQQAMKRQDVSLIAVMMNEARGLADVSEFCKGRIDLAWEATPETTYYKALQTHYGPIGRIAGLIVVLVSAAGVFGGLNTMFAATNGRVRELAMLQTLGFSRRSIALSIIVEGILLASGASLLASIAAIALINGTAVRFTMGAFTLRLDSGALLIGFSVGMAIGIFGAIPPAWRALRMPIVDGLKAV